MQNSRIIYLKNIPKESTGFFFPHYWKVIDLGDEKSKILFVSNEEIETSKNDEFFDEVSFIKNKLCKGNIGSDGCKEVTRQEFDEFFKKTVAIINELSKL